MTYVTIKQTDIDYQALNNEMMNLIQEHHLMPHRHTNQISLTTNADVDDWYCSIGRVSEIKFSEKDYNRIQPSLEGTYLHSIVNQFSEYYRWRLLRVPGRTMPYSIHRDGTDEFKNYRLHIPIQTNPEAFLAFFSSMPTSGETCPIYFQHLECGAAYDVDTTDLHTAWNLGNADRYHIVGVRYARSNNRSQ